LSDWAIVFLGAQNFHLGEGLFGFWRGAGISSSTHCFFSVVLFLQGMKNLILTTLLTTALAVSAFAADNEEKKLPPGLQKKGGLPPGQAKKRGAGGEDQVRTVTNTVYITNTVPGAPATPTTPAVTTVPAVTKAPGTPNTAPAPKTPTVPVATPVKVEKADLEKRVKTVNNLADKEAPRRAGLDAISKETGVPLAKLQAQRREHDGIGLAGLTMANVIAGKTGKPAGTYIRAHLSGKPWDKIAADNGVKLEELDAKVARVEEAMRNVK
jgi:hypothetical protein